MKNTTLLSRLPRLTLALMTLTAAMNAGSVTAQRTTNPKGPAPVVATVLQGTPEQEPLPELQPVQDAPTADPAQFGPVETDTTQTDQSQTDQPQTDTTQTDQSQTDQSQTDQPTPEQLAPGEVAPVQEDGSDSIPDMGPSTELDQATQDAAPKRQDILIDPNAAGRRFCPGNLLNNGDISAFTIGSNSNFPPSVVPGWVLAVFTPQIASSAGYGGTPGWLLGWGYKTGGESFAQSVNIPAGTYRLDYALRAFSNTTAPYAQARISFRNITAPNPWNLAGSTLNIDSGPLSAPGAWVPHTYIFTLPSAVNTFQVNTFNNFTAAQVSGHPERVSWMGYDSFCLRKVETQKPIALHRAVSVRTFPDGRTVMVGSADAAGSAPGTDPDFATVMYDASGNVLWSRVEHLTNKTDEARDVAIDQQGNVVVVGLKNSTGAVYEDTGAVLFKYNGSTGASMGSLTVDATSKQDWFTSVEIDAQNRIVTGGTDNDQTVTAGGWRAFKVRRYLNTNGAPTPDTTFNSTGQQDIKINPHFGLTDYVSTLTDVAIQKDGKILAGGTSRITELGNVNVSVMMRLNANGTLDPSYGPSVGGGGVQTVGMGSGNVVGSGNPGTFNSAITSSFSRILLLRTPGVPTESAVMSGSVSTSPSPLCSVTMLNGNGQLVGGFGGGGSGVTFLKQASCSGIATNGKELAVTGTDYLTPANGDDVLFARLTPTGNLSGPRTAIHNPNGYVAATRKDNGTNLAFNAALGRYVLSGYTNLSGLNDEWFSPLLLK